LLQVLIDAEVPLNFTVPCVVPKFVPAIVTVAPTAPEVGVRLVIVGVARTVNEGPVIDTPLTVTTTVPVVAPVGTVVTIDVLLQVLIDAEVPLNLTVPFVVPKFVPVIVTVAPTAPEVGERLVIARTVNDGPVIDTPLTVTTTVPVVAPVGTGTTIDVLAQLVIVAAVPLNFTVPCVVPKFVPVIVTEAPTAPEVGDRLVIVGDARTVNEVPLLATALTVTTTFPVVAPVGTTATMEVLLQLVIEVATVPLNFTVLVPCVVPKFVPVIVTEAPTAPEVGERLVIVGVADLPTAGAQTIARETRIRDSKEATRGVRFIRKPFLRRQYVVILPLRTAANVRQQRRPSTTQPRTSGYSSTLEVKVPGEALLQCVMIIVCPESAYC
jgi:hypothetical protein